MYLLWSHRKLLVRLDEDSIAEYPLFYAEHIQPLVAEGRLRMERLDGKSISDEIAKAAGRGRV